MKNWLEIDISLFLVQNYLMHYDASRLDYRIGTKPFLIIIFGSFIFSIKTDVILCKYSGWIKGSHCYPKKLRIKFIPRRYISAEKEVVCSR